MPSLVYKIQEQEHRFPLKDHTSIGRGRDNDLCVPSDSISALHAVIKRDGNGYQLEDTGSRNGIVVAGKRVLSCLLHSGDVFALGDVEFVFALDGPELAAAEAPTQTPSSAQSDAVIAQFKEARDHVLGEIGKVIVGQREVLNQMLVALFARGHCLLIGVPGLAKTLMVRTLGSAIDLESCRIQFTPDLMPSDITGTDILEEDSVTGKRAFRFHRGPIFTNLLLADEINRTPPKTQAALLEAMQEQRVTISGTSYDLPSPFMVLATQNPIEQEGTYPLPEAQLDRFMFCIHLAYPNAQEEQQVIMDTTRQTPAAVGSVLNAAQVLKLQQLVRQVPVSQHIALYALSLVRATRPNCEGSLDFVNRWVNWGAGTRAGQYLLLAAKAHVLLQGRFSVSCADVREYALPVLRHRIFPTFTAASEAVTTDQIVKKIVAAVKEPQY
jgi:MoxR-like ATPase